MSGKAGRQQQQQPRSRPFKCVVVGDACVGKTCMVMRIIGKVPDLNEYVPTIVENTEMSATYRGQPCKMEICDTAGQEDYKNLRPASYSSVDLFLLCFCLVDPESFQNLETMWLPELNRYQKGVRVLLVGTKLDLYKTEGSGRGQASVSRAEIDGLRGRHGNLDYVECSALSNQGTKEVLDKMLDSLHKGGGETGRSGRSGRSGSRCDIL